ncbi:hypothetical protein C0033_17015 [Clostridium sp. chh4-2]|uniref:hypothetical protein n=1 Tax=Clostridium sp. chh4-2 TaxID=2067550 RepID=UPI000CCE0F0D|nr:hypothetical protein [Clostridium sp. chh4-2]PNV60890.1 hypothetical protein C0033_17015 [Clostridium sp. chh4-2]
MKSATNVTQKTGNHPLPNDHVHQNGAAWSGQPAKDYGMGMGDFIKGGNCGSMAGSCGFQKIILF